ncbi:transcriptional regulator [Shinella zoogloeoides]|uniref:transcriptional regulator n=1 Tax=Shinella zoogloeoides TaxID=352475 RepID=UPI00273FC9D8|nr:YdaS family helix-turn-helix protein [Shinella zoogloeoides]WLR92921.1 YdaS family helix-turn-helix protein [Shinella zoogloeoides]
METHANIVDRIVTDLGGLTKTATALGLRNPSVVANWRKRGRVPYQRAVEIERLTGISRHILRPDVFGPQPEAAK